MTKTLGILVLLATAIVGAAVPAAAGPRPIIKAIGVFSNVTAQGTEELGCSFFLLFSFAANDPVSGFTASTFADGVCIPAGSTRMPSERELVDAAKARIIHIVKESGGPVLDPDEIVIR